MESFQAEVAEYKKQVAQGIIPKVYRGLLETMLALKTHFQKEHPDYFVSGSLYPGYMDMTYFACTPPALHQRKLKIALVLLHAPLRFEVWLGGANKQVQEKYWKMFQENGWKQAPLVATTHGADAIIEKVLVADPDFSDLEALTAELERGTLQFIQAVEGFLAPLAEA